MIVSESNDFNIVAALCSPVFWLLEEKVVCLCPSLHSGAGFVVAQEEISRERAGRRGGFLTHSRDHLAWPKKI